MRAVALAALAVVAAGCGGDRVATVTRMVRVAHEVAPPARTTLFGHIRSLRHTGREYTLRFDPSWLLSGVTASRAKFEDTGSTDVPNDFYEVEEGHRVLTYRVPTNARVRVLTRAVHGTRITVAQLAELVAGRNPLPRPLFEPLATGFWIVVDGDAVRSLDQQYRP